MPNGRRIKNRHNAARKARLRSFNGTIIRKIRRIVSRGVFEEPSGEPQLGERCFDLTAFEKGTYTFICRRRKAVSEFIEVISGNGKGSTDKMKLAEALSDIRTALAILENTIRKHLDLWNGERFCYRKGFFIAVAKNKGSAPSPETAVIGFPEGMFPVETMVKLHGLGYDASGLGPGHPSIEAHAGGEIHFPSASF